MGRKRAQEEQQQKFSKEKYAEKMKSFVDLRIDS